MYLDQGCTLTLTYVAVDCLIGDCLDGEAWTQAASLLISMLGFLCFGQRVCLES